MEFTASQTIHCTKNSILIRELVAPSLREELVNDVSGCKFSLLIDETTDCTTESVLCAFIRYFGISHEDVVTGFFGPLNIVQATGEVIFEAMKKTLSGLGLQ